MQALSKPAHAPCVRSPNAVCIRTAGRPAMQPQRRARVSNVACRATGMEHLEQPDLGHPGSAPQPQQREVACSDLANLVENIHTQQQKQAQGSASSIGQGAAAAACSSAEGRSDAADAASTSGGAPASPQPQPPAGERGFQYYAGMLTTDVRDTQGATADDMLKRNLQLAGYVVGFLMFVVLGFMASNGLL